MGSRPSEAYDVIVLGLGAMGSAAAYHLASRGARVLGLDAQTPPHPFGSSHGKTRIYREAYYEAPEYVPLVRRAMVLWRELEEASGRTLLTVTGGLCFGAPDTELVSGTLASARAHGVPHEYLDAAEVNRRFPAYRLRDGQMAVYEPGAGLMDPEACVVAHLDLARAHGAHLRCAEPVRRWAADGDGVRVETERGTYHAGRLVVTAGPWAGSLLSGLGVPLEVWRIVHAHFQPDDEERFGLGRCPWAMWEVPEGFYAAFTALPGHGVKFGRHDVGEPTTPETIRREIDPGEVAALRERLNDYLPGAGGEVMQTLTCMYTMTPDRHWVIDRHPEYPQVVFACGFSGHGFKAASVVGEVLADLALDGRTAHNIALFSHARFARGVAAAG